MKPKFEKIYQGMRCRVCLVREGDINPLKISSPTDIYQLVKDELAKADREMFLSIMLATSNHLIGVETVAKGTLNASPISPREVFKSAILANANAIVLCHNHPSGSLDPSPHDFMVTQKLIEAGKVLDIGIYDHLIVSYLGYVSLRESGRIADFEWYSG